MSSLRRRQQAPDPPFVGSNFLSLQATAAGSGRLVELYPRDTVRTLLTKISTFRDRNGKLFPTEEVLADRVTDTREALAVAAGGPQNTVDVDTPGNISIGDIVTLWRLSTNAPVAAKRRVDDKAGSIITLSGAPFTVAIGDLLITGNEFGVLNSQAAGGLWVPPQADVHLRWTAGLRTIANARGDGADLFMLGNSEGSNEPKMVLLSSREDVVEVTAGIGSCFGIGMKSSNAGASFGSQYNSNDGIGKWTRGIWFGNPLLPTLTSVTPTTDDIAPETNADFFTEMEWASNGDGANGHYQVYTKGGNLNGSNSVCNTKIALGGSGHGGSNVSEGVHLLCQLLDFTAGDSLEVVWKAWAAVWVNS